MLDLFDGRGSTLIAAQRTERRAYLMELDLLYCDVIVRRWEQFTGWKGQRVVRVQSADADRAFSPARVIACCERSIGRNPGTLNWAEH